jgi:hypothetical protein
MEISQEAHMANIQKDDVPTYVRELIEKEFQLNRIEEKDQLGNQPFDTEAPREGQQRPIGHSSWVNE